MAMKERDSCNSPTRKKGNSPRNNRKHYSKVTQHTGSGQLTTNSKMDKLVHLMTKILPQTDDDDGDGRDNQQHHGYHCNPKERT